MQFNASTRRGASQQEDAVEYRFEANRNLFHEKGYLRVSEMRLFVAEVVDNSDGESLAILCPTGILWSAGEMESKIFELRPEDDFAAFGDANVSPTAKGKCEKTCGPRWL